MDAQKQQEMLDAVERTLENAIKKYDGQVKDSLTAANETRDEVKALAEKHADLVEQSEALQAKFGEFETMAATSAGQRSELAKSWGKQLADEGLAKMNEGAKNARIEVKNTILGEGGSPQDPVDTIVDSERIPGIVPGAFRMLSVLDVMPMGVTGSNQIEYTRENTFTNNAAETAEGATKPESALTFQLITDPVRTIAHWLKLSKQVLDDAPALQSYVDRRLRHGLRQRFEQQLLTGNGAAPNIAGLSASGRNTAFTPDSGDNQFDSINKAKYAVYGADYVPNVVLLNPTDWGNIERIKTGISGDNSYLAGDGGALAYVNNGIQPMLWGLPVVLSNAVPAGKFFLLDTNATLTFMRQGVTLEMFEQDDTNVQQNLITVRAEMRAAMAVYHQAAVRYGDLVVS